MSIHKGKGKPAAARPRNRPQKDINWSKVDTYLRAQCDGVAIAGILGIHPDTLYLACQRVKKMTFSAYSQMKKAEGKELLRASMYTDALSGNTTMKIWLSKQYLDMSDKNDLTSAGGQIQITPIMFKPQNGE